MGFGIWEIQQDSCLARRAGVCVRRIRYEGDLVSKPSLLPHLLLRLLLFEPFLQVISAYSPDFLLLRLDRLG